MLPRSRRRKNPIWSGLHIGGITVSDRLFIYGTLAPGERNHHMLEHLTGRWERATLRGVLVEEGWGADHGCPAVIPDDRSEPVQGHLFTSEDLSAHWSVLDDFEGDEYRRESVNVGLEDGSEVEAYVYSLRDRDGVTMP